MYQRVTAQEYTLHCRCASFRPFVIDYILVNDLIQSE